MRKNSINKESAGYKACYYILVLVRLVSSVEVSVNMWLLKQMNRI